MTHHNDPKTVAKLLRAIAGGDHAKACRHDVIFNAAADMLDRLPTGAEIVKEQNDRRARELGLPPVRGDYHDGERD